MTGNSELREAVFATYESLATSIDSLCQLLDSYAALGKNGVVPSREMVKGTEQTLRQYRKSIADVRELIKKGREG